MNLVPGLSARGQCDVAASSPRSQRSAAKPTSVVRRAHRAGADPKLKLVYAASITSGLAFSVAWLVTETIAAVLLGWLAAGLLIFSVRTARIYLPSYCCGLVVYAVGFYWMYETVARFGGYGPIVSGLIFLLYVASGALFFLVFAWTHHNLGPHFDAFALRSPTAIVIAELITIRLFYWHFGHTQVAFAPFVQIAGIGGAMLVSFVMFWLAEAGVRMLIEREWRPAFLLPIAAFALSLVYGASMMHALASPEGEKQEVVLVQGPPALTEKRDIESMWQNLARIFELSRQSARPASLIVWPEGAIPGYIPPDLGSVENEPYLPCLRDGSAFLVGGFAIDGQQKRYNTAFAVDADGNVPLPYFKQILIPFGEYMPFSSVFPWLNSLNDNAGLFTPGDEIKVFSYAMERPDGTRYVARAAPLICYEDTVPGPARDATLRGAELLVNLTYDTWFGRSAAPYQHHLIAIFRAIENRRFLVRSTYTGYSAVVSPLGKTVAHIPAFSEGTLTTQVTLMNYQSSYTNAIGERPWWGLLALCVGSIVVNKRKKAGAAMSGPG
jgi:apolipoprotein N-acyltransferase